jgi:chromosome segregation ATPase
VLAGAIVDGFAPKSSPGCLSFPGVADCPPVIGALGLGALAVQAGGAIIDLGKMGEESAQLDAKFQAVAGGADEARKWGFVGSVIELQKLAAHADKTKNMEDKVKAKHSFKLTAQQILSAALGNEVEIEVDINAEAATQLTAYAAEVKELTITKDELKADVEAKDAAITAAAAEVAKLQATHIEIEERATKAEAEVAKLTAEVAKLKTTPIAEPIKAKGEDTQTPAAVVDDAPKYKKLTAEEKQKHYAKAFAV